MASKKATKTKKSTAKATKKVAPAVAPEIEEHDEEIEADIISPKSKLKKPAEVDAADILPEVAIDEKIDEDAPVIPLEDEEAEELPTLDDEDLNPFGDKWEE
ncbi:MAG TPA: hypothetical protein VL335_03135 [Candidatus Paceibacterota bacterium]|jgi:hypothetical protein|nr:hypothetical protein [Candidatus Paceibacterota bacterium]